MRRWMILTVLAAMLAWGAGQARAAVIQYTIGGIYLTVPGGVTGALSGSMTLTDTPAHTVSAISVVASGIGTFDLISFQGVFGPQFIIRLLNQAADGFMELRFNTDTSLFSGAGATVDGFSGIYLSVICEECILVASIAGITLTAVPEPAAVVLLSAGLAGLGFARRRGKA